jgi:diguanylate cyclase (GGDEF)-like protein
MRNSRHVLSAVVIAAAVLVPTSPVSATTDMNDTIRKLAADAADLVAEEQALLAIANPDSATPDAQLAEIRTKLTSVDTQGMAVLRMLDRLDIELTGAIRITLDRLPRPDVRKPREAALLPPDDLVYEAAIADLNRITTTPRDMGSGDESSRSTSGLLAVAAISLLVLGAAALASTARRRPVADDLAAMAWSDGLTGLANRRRLDRDLDSLGPLTGQTAVIMVDVDHFKSVNDNFGHQKGDDVLRSIGTMLANQIRHDDVVYRYGGEEFCILLPESSADAARQVADRIVEAARQIALPDGQHITVSVGVADSIGANVYRAVESADLALYRAKDLGRDQAVTAEQTHVTVA